jgi:hypothetical protein
LTQAYRCVGTNWVDILPISLSLGGPRKSTYEGLGVSLFH